MNKVILLGRLTADPELRYTSGTNIPVCRFRLAVDRPYQKTGADFLSIVAWRSTAEFVSKYFRKGVRVLVEGNLRNNVYEDNQRVRHNLVEIHAERVFFADAKRDDAPGGFTQPSYGKSAPGSDDGFFPLSDDDDELPF